MLGWRDVRVREASWGDNYFDPQEMQRESERFQTLVTVLEERWGAGVAGLFERAWRSEVLADCATFGEWLVMLPEAVPAPEVPPVGVTTEEPEPDALRVLMDLGRQFEERGQLESALQTYRRACELAPAGSGLAEELALIVQDLEGKQREATVPEPPPLPVEEVVGTGTPVRPPEEEEVVFPGPQPLSEGGMAAEAETAAPPPKLPLEEAAVEPVAPTPGSALEKELALIAEGAESKPQEEAPPFELQPSAVEAEAEVTIPPAGKGADLDRLFDDGLAAYGRGEWAKAKELLREVVRRQPVYERDGYEAARTLLAEAERRLAPARRKRVSGWAWALLGLVFVIAWIIYSNYQAERRALVEALKATALAQYQATVTAQAQATATARDQATAQAQAAATVQARATTTARDQATMQPQAAATVQARATATAQAQAAVADSCNPSADQVALFVDANYGGQCVVKGIGQYSNPSAIGLPNDSVSSIRVGSNIQATLYEHDDYQGLYETFTSGDVDLRNNITGDNMVSSVKVQRCASALGVITPENARRIRELRVFQSQSWVESVAFSPDGKVLAWAGDGGIWLHDLQQNRLLRHLTGHTAQTHSVVFSPDGTQLYSGGVDEGGGRIKAWDWRTGAELWSVVAAPEGWGALVRVSNDGQWLASNACWENILWRVSSGEPQRYAELSENGSWPALSPDGKWIAFWEEGRVRLVHVGDTSRFLNVPYSPESVQDFGSFVAFSPNASIVASGMPDGKIRLWKVSDGTLLRTLDGHAQRVWSVIFSPDGQLLVSEAEDDELRLWRVSDGALVHILTDPTGGVRDGAVVFSPDGTLLASATPDGHVRLWGITD
jgi:WD40 repeat protein/tetratricopeptide (TPR) repeat protein